MVDRLARAWFAKTTIPDLTSTKGESLCPSTSNENIIVLLRPPSHSSHHGRPQQANVGNGSRPCAVCQYDEPLYRRVSEMRRKLTIDADMYVKRHEFFRWNRKTAGLTVLYMAVIPGALYWVARSTEVSSIPYAPFSKREWRSGQRGTQYRGLNESAMAKFLGCRRGEEERDCWTYLRLADGRKTDKLARANTSSEGNEGEIPSTSSKVVANVVRDVMR